MYNFRSSAHERFPTVWERPNFYSSPAIFRSLAACLDVSDLSEKKVDTFDFYSYVNKSTILSEQA